MIEDTDAAVGAPMLLCVCIYPARLVPNDGELKLLLWVCVPQQVNMMKRLVYITILAMSTVATVCIGFV